MDSYTEVRRIRELMSKRAGHDIRTLIASINEKWPDDAARAIDPGTKAEQCNAAVAGNEVSGGERSPATL